MGGEDEYDLLDFDLDDDLDVRPLPSSKPKASTTPSQGEAQVGKPSLLGAGLSEPSSSKHASKEEDKRVDSAGRDTDTNRQGGVTRPPATTESSSVSSVPRQGAAGTADPYGRGGGVDLYGVRSESKPVQEGGGSSSLPTTLASVSQPLRPPASTLSGGSGEQRAVGDLPAKPSVPLTRALPEPAAATKEPASTSYVPDFSRPRRKGSTSKTAAEPASGTVSASAPLNTVADVARAAAPLQPGDPSAVTQPGSGPTIGGATAARKGDIEIKGLFGKPKPAPSYTSVYSGQHGSNTNTEKAGPSQVNTSPPVDSAQPRPALTGEEIKAGRGGGNLPKGLNLFGGSSKQTEPAPLVEDLPVGVSLFTPAKPPPHKLESESNTHEATETTTTTTAQPDRQQAEPTVVSGKGTEDVHHVTEGAVQPPPTFPDTKSVVARDDQTSAKTANTVQVQKASDASMLEKPHSFLQTARFDQADTESRTHHPVFSCAAAAADAPCLEGRIPVFADRKVPPTQANKYACSAPPLAASTGGVEDLDAEYRSQPVEVLQMRNQELRSQLDGIKAQLKQSLAAPPVAVSHIARYGLNRFTAAMLEKQLKTALKRIAAYKYANNMLRQKMERLGSSDSLERLETQVREKEARIVELTEERRALLALQRSFEKQLIKEQDAREHMPEMVSSLQKDVMVYQHKLQRLRAFIDTMKQQRRDQEEHLHIMVRQNKELLERAQLGPDLIGPEVLADPSKLLSKRRRRSPMRAKEVAAEKQRLEAEVETLSERLKQCRRSADQQLKVLRKGVEAAKEEKDRLVKISQIKKKESRLQMLQMNILKRTLRDVSTGTISVKDARSIVMHVRDDKGCPVLPKRKAVGNHKPAPQSARFVNPVKAGRRVRVAAVNGERVPAGTEQTKVAVKDDNTNRQARTSLPRFQPLPRQQLLTHDPGGDNYAVHLQEERTCAGQSITVETLVSVPSLVVEPSEVAAAEQTSISHVEAAFRGVEGDDVQATGIMLDVKSSFDSSAVLKFSQGGGDEHLYDDDFLD